MNNTTNTKRALILVDIQNDFVPGGALAVPKGNEVVPVANQLMAEFDLVVATQDWHPAGHGSFASSHPGHKVGDVIDLNGLPQILWPAWVAAGLATLPLLDLYALGRRWERGHFGTPSGCVCSTWERAR